ncbi:MAG TPA: hypothetical protein VGL12_17070 [Roseiarcus sp.]|jgi:hypothetical protein
MRTLSAFAPMVALSIGVTLAAPASALAAHRVHPSRNHVVQTHRFGKAMALAPILPVIRAVPAKDTDGLSRDAEDCNKGCIDNGR